ncbi:MAG: cytochrome P450 [Anaerolineae bacterium]|nr:cytochrome P450 [Anaerolineae bacterium]
MTRIPRDKSFDSTLALFLDPYEFISKRCRRYGSDLFQTRLMLRKTICMTGPQAAELFYDPSRFMRRGAMPDRIQKTLLGQGGVQGLDDEAHRQRKQMFMALMIPERIGQLGELSGDWWRTYAQKWATMDRVVLYDEVREILTRAVCAWAGVPLAESEVGRRTRELTALFDYAGTIGPKHWWSRLARRWTERWIEGVVGQVRAGRLNLPEQSAVHVIATHRDLNGNLLTPHVAAVELLNVLRPTVAVAVYITFVAHALHQHPECRQKFQAAQGSYVEWFVQEVRRFYPFFPSVIARVRHDFEWQGYPFPQGVRVILDLYGTNHDARTWDAPEAFRPERFRRWDGSPFNFIPQGGGDHSINHRCPGEWIAIELMKVASDVLTKRIKYEVPEQDLRIDWSRLPALPHSRFIINNVRVDVR